MAKKIPGDVVHHLPADMEEALIADSKVLAASSPSRPSQSDAGALFDSVIGATIAEDGMTSRRGGLRQSGKVSKTDTLSPCNGARGRENQIRLHAGVIGMAVAWARA